MEEEVFPNHHALNALESSRSRSSSGKVSFQVAHGSVDREVKGRNTKQDQNLKHSETRCSVAGFLAVC